MSVRSLSLIETLVRKVGECVCLNNCKILGSELTSASMDVITLRNRKFKKVLTF